MATAYTLACLQSGSTLIPVRSADPDFAVEEFLEGSGTVQNYNSYAAAKSAKPKISFEASALKSVLDLWGLYAPIAVGSGTQVTQYYSKLVDGGFREANGVKNIMNNGLALLRSLDATHNEPATCKYDLIGRWDGTNHPFTTTTGQAIPSSTTVQDQLYTLGPVSINSTLYGTRRASFNPGYQEFSDGISGEAFPDMVAILKGDPKAEVSLADPAILSTLTGVGAIFTNVKLYFRKVSQTLATGRVADGTAEHIKVTFAKARVKPTTISGAWGAVGDMGISIIPIADGTNAVCAISTASAIAA